MPKGQRVITVAITLVIVAALFGPFVTAVSSSTGVQSVTNETVNASAGEYVNLEGFDVEAGSVSVYNNSDDLQTEGVDYEIEYDNGSLLALSGGSIADGEELGVTYEYAQTSDVATTVAELLPLILLVTILGVVAFAVKSMANSRGMM